MSTQTNLIRRPVTTLKLSQPAQAALKRNNVVTVADLVQRSDFDLLSMVGFKHSDLEVVSAYLAEHGLRLRI
jgi:DNA-directed RNA polymerase alpha subunit